MYQLRDFQEKTCQVCRYRYDNGDTRILNVLATGLGKSVIIGKIGEFFPEHFKHGLLYLVHRRKLVMQQAKKFEEIWPSLRVETEMSTLTAQADADIVVASSPTLGSSRSRRIHKFNGRFGIICTDEAHRGMTATTQKVLNHFGVGSDPYQRDIERISLGFTATPNRTDKQGLWPIYDTIGVEYDLLWGMMNGWLVPISVQAVPTSTNIGAARIGRDGEFVAKDLAKYVNVHERNDLVVRSYAESGRGKAIAFTANIDHAEALAEEFRNFGVEAYATHSGNGIHDLTPEKRLEIEEAHRRGDYPVMVGVDVFSEGYDDPEVECVLMARPTKSLLWFTQAVGRGIRPIQSPHFPSTSDERKAWIKKTKKPDCLLMDFTDNAGRHKDGLVSPADLFAIPKALLESERPFDLGDLLQILNVEEGAEKRKRPKGVKDVTKVPRLEFIKLDLLESREPDDLIRKVSKNDWVLEDGCHLLYLPSEDCVIKVEQDALGRHRARMISGDGHIMIGRSNFLDRESAIQYYDKYVALNYPDDKHAILNREGIKEKLKEARKELFKHVRRTSFDIHKPHAYLPSRMAHLFGKADTIMSAEEIKQRAKWLADYRKEQGLSADNLIAWINSTFKEQ